MKATAGCRRNCMPVKRLGETAEEGERRRRRRRRRGKRRGEPGSTAIQPETPDSDATPEPASEGL